MDNRKLAGLLLLVAFVAWGLSRQPVRRHVPGLLGTLLSPAILAPLVALVAYVWLLSHVGARVGLWNPRLIPATVVWFFSLALSTFFNIDKVRTDRRFLLAVLRRTVEFTVLLELLANLFTFSLLAELALQAFIAFGAVMVVVAAQRPENAPVKRLGDSVLAVIGFGVLGYSIRQLIVNWSDIDKADLVFEAVLPVWMTVGFLPFLVLLAVYYAYDRPLRALWRVDSGSRLPRAKAAVALVRSFRHHTSAMKGFGPYWTGRMVEADSVAGASAVALEFLDRARQRQRAEEEGAAKLIRYAGVDGADADGRRLDRREFEATTLALDWLGTCHQGHYRNLGRYGPDMLTLVEDSPSFDGLPDQAGIEMHISADSQAWWAWRRTVTGWCLAVGARGGGATWKMSAAEPPSGPPGTDPAWGEDLCSGLDDVNW